MTQTALWIWLTPALAALFFYGIGQGLVKKYIGDVPPARFCLFFVFAKAIVNLGYYFSQGAPSPFALQEHKFMWVGLFAYLLDGTGWILYFQSIIAGPITIVGTLSAAYPALTVLFARIFLSEMLTPVQYFGVGLVILGCIGLSYDSSSGSGKIKNKIWIVYAASALVLWGAAQTIVKYAYTLPEANEALFAVLNTCGGALTLGVYGVLRGRSKSRNRSKMLREWGISFMPMAMMALGDLGVIVASRFGPISIVTPLTGAYPVVTLAFAALVLKEKITAWQLVCVLGIVAGMVISPGV